MESGNVSSWAESIQNGVGEALQTVVAYIPNILGALVVLLVGVVVAAILKGAVVKLLKAVKVKPFADKIGVNRVFPGQYDVVDLLGDLVKWFFIIVFLLQALSIANLLQVNDLVRSLLAYIPDVLAAVVVVLIGAVVADLTSRIVTNAARAVGATTARLLGDVAKYAILGVVAFTALAQLGVNTLFLDRLFTAIVVMLALAGGLAFGLGGRDLAKDVLEGVRSSFKREV
ncbi:MAG TPA: hypothetical protein VK963_03385 [Candidatus Saccharimonadales bacterium]|nr:hypothetical protein [Candidatus Saccharimonadales bacterium]